MNEGRVLNNHHSSCRWKLGIKRSVSIYFPQKSEKPPLCWSRIKASLEGVIHSLMQKLQSVARIKMATKKQNKKLQGVYYNQVASLISII